MIRRPVRPLVALIVLGLLLAATAYATEKAEIHDVEGDVQKPVKIEGPAPVYPPALKEERVEGQVLARTVITDEGRVESIEILETPRPEFGDAVRESLAQWTFEPATLDGEPVAVYYHLTINFRLSKDSADEAKGDAPAAGRYLG